MYRLMLVFLCALVLTGCFAYVDNQGDFSRVKSFIITDDEALDLLEKAEAKDPSQKHEIKFFQPK